MNIAHKNLYSLKKIKNDTDHLFDSIKKNIPTSIFSSLNNRFFLKMVKNKIIHLYVIQYKKKDSAIITVVTVKNLIKLKYNFFLFFLTHPLLSLFNIIKIFKSISRGSSVNFDKSYLHLLHFIIFKKNFMGIPIKKKDQIINFFFRHILRAFNTKSLFLCYEKKNFKADKFYLRNNFIVYKTNKNLVFIKKRIR